MKKFQYNLMCLVLLLSAGLSGCGHSGSQLPTAAVSGTVIYQEKALAGGRVLFQHTSGQAASADIATDGSFKLNAFQGKNKVAVYCYQCIDDPSGPLLGVAPHKPVKSIIPDRYTEIAKSGLTIDVQPDGNQDVELSLTD